MRRTLQNPRKAREHDHRSARSRPSPFRASCRSTPAVPCMAARQTRGKSPGAARRAHTIHSLPGGPAPPKVRCLRKSLPPGPRGKRKSQRNTPGNGNRVRVFWMRQTICSRNYRFLHRPGIHGAVFSWSGSRLLGFSRQPLEIRRCICIRRVRTVAGVRPGEESPG